MSVIEKFLGPRHNFVGRDMADELHPFLGISVLDGCSKGIQSTGK